MRVRDLEGNTGDWKLKGDIVNGGHDTRSRSQLHTKARQILYRLFPTSMIIEEILINPRPRVNQYLDFFINGIKLVVEVNGAQHYKFNALFHTSSQDFLNQKKRDNDKEEWCKLNGLTFIALPYNESEEQWETRILNR